jgi:hypothetical protein
MDYVMVAAGQQFMNIADFAEPLSHEQATHQRDYWEREQLFYVTKNTEHDC